MIAHGIVWAGLLAVILWDRFALLFGGFCAAQHSALG
jgi:hypothetical protein